MIRPNSYPSKKSRFVIFFDVFLTRRKSWLFWQAAEVWSVLRIPCINVHFGWFERIH